MLVLLVLLFRLAQSDNTVTFLTGLGKITGLSSTVNINNVSYNYHVFKRVPFAKPPIGDLRFKEPVPHGMWSGTLNATTFGPSCMQPPINDPTVIPDVSEDCLFLNIYTPESSITSVKKSVMIWIHGGGYNFGQGMGYPGEYMSVLGDVIIVTINYRLGVFGFFSTTDDVAPGNYGLWDQKLAIKWVHDNIDSFGGDQKSITIFGESAGGWSVGLQILNPTNKGLFQRAIAQSGIGNSLVALSPVARSTAVRIANALNCSDSLSDITMECLRNRTATELSKASFKAANQQLALYEFSFIIAYAPVIDGRFLTDHPVKMMNSLNGSSIDFFRSLDVIIGACEGEGSLLMGNLFSKHYNISAGIPSSYLCDHILPSFPVQFYNNNTRIVSAVCKKYKTTESIEQQSMQAINFYGDAFFYSPAIQSLNVHSRGNHITKTFQYMIQRLINDQSNMVPWFKEAGHGYEVIYLFPWKPLASTEAKELSKILILYWTNFAKTGYVL
ncbi:Putative inactive carboxylesterase 4,Juvenile hormone esterase [Mytilus coruscus]|uniref:Carboxylic ester hydrolase n=1 Tax=Mytilus coruscus TaxID=42192 RepID=A0A6J8E6H8_MYTCO|nr:Putative inactive carboxylesterase 4,Juvenile hormone esterase [Mytilus coruscus]